MAKVKFSTITIRNSEQASDDSRLFVLNRSNPPGNINFNVTDGSGGRIVITVPLTACPVDLSNFAEKVAILKNPDFRRMVAKTAIVLVDPDEAEKFVTTDPRGIKETKRIYGVIDEGIDPELSLDISSPETPTPESLGIEANNPFIENIVLRSAEEDVADLISEVDSKLHTLKVSDIEYLSKHSKNAELKEWAAAQLEDMNAE